MSTEHAYRCDWCGAVEPQDEADMPKGWCRVEVRTRAVDFEHHYCAACRPDLYTMLDNHEQGRRFPGRYAKAGGK